LLILDEPTNGLDPAGIHEFRALIRRLVGEGRTVLLSSHLLDEVEKICDAAAIVDRGRVVAQGSLADLRGARQRILIGAADAVRAQVLAAAHPTVLSASTTADGIRVTLLPDRAITAEQAAADLNRRLVEAGVAVHRVEPTRASLEERFLEITSRLGVAA
jgi:ABC-2 type transport system ATP-binding protein